MLDYSLISRKQHNNAYTIYKPKYYAKELIFGMKLILYWLNTEAFKNQKITMFAQVYIYMYNNSVFTDMIKNIWGNKIHVYMDTKEIKKVKINLS